MRPFLLASIGKIPAHPDERWMAKTVVVDCGTTPRTYDSELDNGLYRCV